MNLDLAPEDREFQQEVRDFFANSIPEEWKKTVRAGLRLSPENLVAYQRRLADRGWGAPTWPKEYGGTGWSPQQLHIFWSEASAADAPAQFHQGLELIGPIIFTYGSQVQKDFYLPRIISGEDWWCQGYSEPGAGSDLAALRTRAARDGDDYVVNGHKMWTSYAHVADRMFILARTSTEGRRQQGISLMLVDMDTPGITVRPIILLDGGAEVNEVFFDNVKVPAENLVGEENKGWTYAKYLLTHERTNIAGVGFSQAGLSAVKRIAKSEMAGGRPLIENPHFAARVAQAEIDLMAMATTNLRIISKAAAGQAPGVESSMLKVKGTIIRQEINDLARRAAGVYAMPFASEAVAGSNDALPDPNEAGPVAAQYFNNRKLSIFGGSNEIQRQIIAKTTLGGAK